MTDNSEIRSLRSKGTDTDTSDDRFDFNTDDYSINPDKLLRLEISGNYSGKLAKHKNVSKCESDIMKVKEDSNTSENLQENDKTSDELVIANFENTKDNITRMILDIEYHHIDEKNENIEQNNIDPLSDNLYSSYHKKMLRQERRMIEQDMIQGEEEADRISLIYDKLNMPIWISTLQKVTKINNPCDENELEYKKKLTQKHIKDLLNKYALMKRHSSVIQKTLKKHPRFKLKRKSQLYSHINRRYLYDYQSSSDDDTDDSELDIDLIREKRLLKREKKSVGSIVIGSSYKSLASSTVAIIAEPFRKPYTIISTTRERKKWKKLPPLPQKLRAIPKMNSQIAKYKRKVSIPLTLSRPSNESISNITDHPNNCNNYNESDNNNGIDTNANMTSNINDTPICDSRKECFVLSNIEPKHVANKAKVTDKSQKSDNAQVGLWHDEVNIGNKKQVDEKIIAIKENKISNRDKMKFISEQTSINYNNKAKDVQNNFDIIKPDTSSITHEENATIHDASAALSTREENTAKLASAKDCGVLVSRKRKVGDPPNQILPPFKIYNRQIFELKSKVSAQAANTHPAEKLGIIADVSHKDNIILPHK